MAVRTPLPNINLNYSAEFKEGTAENSNEIDYNSTNTNKARISQSPVGGKTTNYTNENISANKEYKRAVPLDNCSALFDTQFAYIPPGQSKYSINKNVYEDVNRTKGPFTALERSVKESKDKVETTDKRVEDLDTALGADTNTDFDMAFYGNRMSDLEMRNKQHSAKIHDLERELRNVRVENSRIKGQLVGPETNGGYRGMGGNLDRIPEAYDARKDYYQEPGQPDSYRGRQEQQAPPNPGPQDQSPRGRRQYENEQHRVAHRAGGADQEPYWGFNKFYDPQYITAYRREHIPYYAKHEEREKADADPGGLYILRFDDAGYEDARVAFRSLQTIMKSYDGRMLGIARKHNVFDIEGDADWHVSKQRKTRQHGRMNFNEVEDAIALMWFPKLEKAKKYYENMYKNRFQEINFPTPRSYEAHFVHLLARPIHRELDTYLVIELLNAKHYSSEQLQTFEKETRDAIIAKMPSCIPFIAATSQGHHPLRTSTLSLFRDRSSKIFISVFTSMNELAFLWESGTIQQKMQEFNIKRPNNVWSFALRDWQD